MERTRVIKTNFGTIIVSNSQVNNGKNLTNNAKND